MHRMSSGFVALAALAMAASGCAAQRPPATVGQAAPPLQLASPRGEVFKMSTPRANPLVLIFARPTMRLEARTWADTLDAMRASLNVQVHIVMATSGERQRGMGRGMGGGGGWGGREGGGGWGGGGGGMGPEGGMGGGGMAGGGWQGRRGGGEGRGSYDGGGQQMDQNTRSRRAGEMLIDQNGSATKKFLGEVPGDVEVLVIMPNNIVKVKLIGEATPANLVQLEWAVKGREG